MKLPFAFGKKEIKNYFLALLFQDEKIGAVIFEESTGEIQVVSRSEEHFTTSLEESAFEEWLDIVDKAVSIAEEILPGIQTKKTVFGVKQEWILDGKIKKEYLAKLKRICDELELQPIGFLVFSEAIIHLLQKEEGAPVSAIMVEIGKKIIDISIIRAGRVVATKQIPFTTPVPHAIDTALKQFGDIEIFPSRIILFDSEHNEKRSQSFIGHSWSKSLPFLHMPQITILPPGFDTKGVLFGTATQMRFSVAKNDLHIPIKTHMPHEEKQEFEKAEFAENFVPQEKEDKTEGISSAEHEESRIVEHEPLYAIPKEEAESMKHEGMSSDYFGFVKNRDITSIPHGKTDEKRTHVPSDVVEQTIEEIPEEVKDKETEYNKSEGFPVNGMLLFEGIKKGLTKIPFNQLFQKKRRIFAHQSEEIKQGKLFHKLFIIISVIAIACIAATAWYITSLKAIVTLTITPQQSEEKQTVTFAVGGSNNFNKNTIAAQDAQTQEDGSLSEDATGTKQIGTAAKGTITIFSTVTSSSSIPKGTTVTSSNNLNFTFDNDVSIASSSGNAGDFVTVSNINVTAKNIGTDSNLPSGTKFTISGFDKSDVSGKNDAPFSGGTQKNVTVVSQKDLDSLVTNLTKNLSDKAKNAMNTNQNGEKVLLPFFTKEEATKKTFSKNINDEASSVSLTATIVFHGASYTKSDIAAFAQSVFQNKIPSDSTLGKNGIQTTVSDVKQDKDTTSGTLDMKASFIPKIDTESLIKTITGKSFTQADSLLRSTSQITNVTIQRKPNILFLPKFLPKFSKNIQITTNE